MTPSTLLGSGSANFSLLCLVFLTISGSAMANSILAFAPITALAGYEGLNARHDPKVGSCPAATQTPCADGLGCCPNGAACTYSKDIAVCDEACNGGPSCPNGGCCQSGYVCGKENNFCSPAAMATKAPAAPPANKEVDDDMIITRTTPAIPKATPPSAPLHADPAPDADEDDILPSDTDALQVSTSKPAKTGSVPSAHHPLASATSTPTSSTSTTSQTHTHTGTRTKYVAGNAGGTATKKEKTPRPSAKATSTGAAHSIEATDSFMTFIVGWIAGLAVVL